MQSKKIKKLRTDYHYNRNERTEGNGQHALHNPSVLVLLLSLAERRDKSLPAYKANMEIMDDNNNKY